MFGSCFSTALTDIFACDLAQSGEAPFFCQAVPLTYDDGEDSREVEGGVGSDSLQSPPVLYLCVIMWRENGFSALVSLFEAIGIRCVRMSWCCE